MTDITNSNPISESDFDYFHGLKQSLYKPIYLTFPLTVFPFLLLEISFSSLFMSEAPL